MIYLICPSNYFLMPYIRSYIHILKSENIEYRVIYWDRLNKQENVQSSQVYSDKKIGFKRNFIDYLKYYFYLIRFFKKNLKSNDKLIVFSIQLIPILLSINHKYIIDIRDYHKFVDFKCVQTLIRKANFVVVSSKKFKEFLQHSNVIVSHNFNSDSTVETNYYSEKNNTIKIANIGAIRDFDANKNLINSLKNREDIVLTFHGTGPAVTLLTKYVIEKDIKNVIFTGKYNPTEEDEFYRNADVINLVRDNSSYNNQIALPNRLYKASKFNKPVITTNGTYLSEVVSQNSLGVILNENALTDKKLNKLIHIIRNNNLLFKRQQVFLNEIYEENNIFINEIRDFMR